MRTIYKYRLLITDKQVLAVHPGFKPLHVEEQDGELFIWGEVDTLDVTKPIEPVAGSFMETLTNATVVIYGTGEPMWAHNFSHFQTVLMSDGMVWHVYFKEDLSD